MIYRRFARRLVYLVHRCCPRISNRNFTFTYWFVVPPMLRTFSIAKFKSDIYKPTYQDALRQRFGFLDSLAKRCRLCRYSSVDLIVHYFYVIWRCFLLLFAYGPILITYPLIRWNKKLKTAWWKMLFFLVQRSGPILLKFGQWMSTRRDLFSRELCDLFAELQRKSPPHSWLYSEQAMKAVLGENWQQYFLNFEHDICGSGCVAQVHKARLDVKRAVKNPDFQLEKQAKFSSMDVAIKILHPSVDRDLEVDLAVLHFFASLASLFQISSAIDIKESLEQFSEALWKQIDLRFESTALKIFRHNFRWNDDVRFPQPLLESPCVLIETFEEGSPITDFLDHPDTKLKCKLAKWGMDALLKMIFDDNFVHCDMHSGNIFVQERSTDDYDQDLLDQTFANYLKTDADRPNLLERLRSTIMAVYGRLSYRLSRMGFIENQYRLILLDTGLFAELSQRDLNNLKAVFRAIVINDGKAVADLMCQEAPRQQCEDVEAFRSDMDNLVKSALTNTLDLSTVDVAKLLSDLFAIVSKHNIRLETNFSSTVLSVIILEGLGRCLDPKLHLIDCAKRYLSA